MTDEAPPPSPDPVPVAPAAAPAVTDELPPRAPGRIARSVAEARARGRIPELAAFLAFLVPGLGHIYLGRLIKGTVAFFFLCGLYIAGITVTNGECVSLDRQNGHPYAFFAQVGCGLPTGVALLRTHSYEVRRWLGDKDVERPDEPNYETKEMIARLPHLDEGLLYTMIAGLLNLLLIYDALLGAPGAVLRRDREDAA